MKTVNVRETREQLAALLDAVATGEDILIVRNGKPAARLVPPERRFVGFEDRSALRASLPSAQESSAATLRAMRDEERY